MKHIIDSSYRIAVAATLIGCTLAAQAQAPYPNKPITIVYPYAGGSASDTMTRQIAEAMSKELGQPVIVETKPGAGGSIALEYVTRAPADGYTLALTASGSMSVNPHIYKLNYKPVDDLASITILTEIPFIVVANMALPTPDLQSFITLAKNKPGQISFANAGQGTQAHLTQIAFMKAAGIDANVISYKGGAPATTDLLGGHVNAMIDNAAAQVSNVKAGKVRPLFVTTQTRSPSLPSVPTAEEAGLRGFVTSGWFGLAAPKGTPTAVIERLHSAVAKSMAAPALRQKLTEAGWMPIASTPAEATARAQGDLQRLGAIARDLGLAPN